MVLGFEFLICPVSELTVVPFSYPSCDISSWSVRSPVVWDRFYVKEIHQHTFYIALFTSLLAPMGGFFASGFKRAINIKDFANTIPGHGGYTDRMDCQILVGIFTYIWLSIFVFKSTQKLSLVIKLLEAVSDEGKLKVFNYLKSVIPSSRLQ